MTDDPRWKNGARRRRDRARWKAIGAVCGICGEPIDYDLPFYIIDPITGKKSVNPDAFVIDEIDPYHHSKDLSRENQQPAHMRCNLKKGGTMPDEFAADSAKEPSGSRIVTRLNWLGG